MYEKQTWRNGDTGTPLSALRLGHIEDGIEAATETAATVLGDIAGKVRANVADAGILIVGDSTSAGQQIDGPNGVNGWVERFALSLAILFPTHTIVTRYWTDGTPGAWGADKTVIPGTGARKITIHVAAVAGKSWQYHLDASRREAMLAVGADAVFIMLGHNEDNGAAQTGNTAAERGKVLGKLADLEQLVELGSPTAGVASYQGAPAITLMSTNPLGSYANASESRADMYRRIARGRGYGFIDVNAAFRADPRPYTDLVYDNTHPTAAGYAIISNLVVAAFREAPRSRQLLTLPAMLSSSERNLVKNGGLTNLDGSNKPSDWVLNNVTAAVDTTDFETGTKSLVLTKTTDNGGGAIVRIPLPALVKGKTVTVAARVKIPSGQGNLVGQLGFNNGSQTVQGFVWTEYDQWLWRVFTFRFAPTATATEVRLQVANSVGNLPGQLKLDRLICVLGSFPADLNTDAA